MKKKHLGLNIKMLSFGLSAHLDISLKQWLFYDNFSGGATFQKGTLHRKKGTLHWTEKGHITLEKKATILTVKTENNNCIYCMCVLVCTHVHLYIHSS